jgi:hypothetical protein
VEELATNQTRNLIVVCERLFLDIDNEISDHEMAEKIKECLEDDPLLLGKMLRKESIQLLFSLWEQEESKIPVESYVEELQQLRYLGFVYPEKEFIAVNLEAKDIFYFSLKGRKMQEIMDRYEMWEQIVLGMLYAYGILDVDFGYQTICRLLREEISYDELELFLMRRITFWQGALLLRSQRDKKLFMASREVSDRNAVFDQWNEEKDLDFKEYSLDEYTDLTMTTGIVNWDGVPELFTYLLDRVDGDRYRATLIVKQIILMIQNGDPYLDVVMQGVKMLPPPDEEEEALEQDEKEFCDGIKLLFYSVPVFGLKGHSRGELSRKSECFRS